MSHIDVDLLTSIKVSSSSLDRNLEGKRALGGDRSASERSPHFFPRRPLFGLDCFLSVRQI